MPPSALLTCINTEPAGKAGAAGGWLLWTVTGAATVISGSVDACVRTG